jgi:hypothetical protein
MQIRDRTRVGGENRGVTRNARASIADEERNAASLIRLNGV